MAKSSKSNKITYILIAIGVLFIISGGVYYYINRAKKDTSTKEAPQKEKKPYESAQKPVEASEDPTTGKQTLNPDTPIT